MPNQSAVVESPADRVHRRLMFFRSSDILTCMSADQKRVHYYSQQMEEGYRFMQEMMRYPVAECGEPLESLVDAAAAAGVDVEFSCSQIVTGINRMFLLRRGLIADFLAIAREMNERGWVLKVEDGYRTCQMQKLVSRKPVVFDSILQWTMRELDGKIPDVKLLTRRVASMTASCPKIGTHMSGSAIDMSVLHRDDRTELARGASYLAMCELTPMASPFVSAEAQKNRAEITSLMAKHGFIAYPWEFWHYNKGDAYAEYLQKTGQPGRYGAINWNVAERTITPIQNPLTLLNSEAEIQFEIEQALQRLGHQSK